ncbi:MAG: hypothetical protein ACYTG7_24140 [Planctomycetota bacterium]
MSSDWLARLEALEAEFPDAFSCGGERTLAGELLAIAKDAVLKVSTLEETTRLPEFPASVWMIVSKLGIPLAGPFASSQLAIAHKVRIADWTVEVVEWKVIGAGEQEGDDV